MFLKNKKLIGVFLCIAAVFLGFGIGIINNSDKDLTGDSEFYSQVVKAKGGYKIRHGADNKRYLKVREKKIYETMHMIANAKIISDEKWGQLPATEDRINYLIIVVANSDYYDKDDLLDILSRWRNGDFRQCDSDHNYVWSKLGGTVGYAIGVKEKYKHKKVELDK